MLHVLHLVYCTDGEGMTHPALLLICWYLCVRLVWLGMRSNDWLGLV